jgi:hypothetical protein
MPHEQTHMVNGRKDPGSTIASQIEALTEGRAIVTLKSERAWASITFSGTRYRLSIARTCASETGEMQNLAQALPNHEFAIPGHFVADMMVLEQSEDRLLVEVLSIIDPVETPRARSGSALGRHLL